MATPDSKPKQLPLPLEGATVEIPLTRGQVTLIDAVDADLLQHKWHALFDEKYPPKGAYKANREINLGDGKCTCQLMHRVILGRVIGRELTAAETVDHKNLNTLDNRRENLRLASMSEQSRNRRMRNDNTSGYKGVYYLKNNRKWTAIASIKGERFYLGSFDTKEEAHEARLNAVKLHYGEFARED